MRGRRNGEEDVRGQGVGLGGGGEEGDRQAEEKERSVERW